MAILKRSLIKRTTKKRARQLLDSVGPPNSDMLGTLKNWINLAESVSADIGGFGLPLHKISDWQQLYYSLIVVVVSSELAYYPSIGSDGDIALALNCATEELANWAEKYGGVPVQEK